MAWTCQYKNSGKVSAGWFCTNDITGENAIVYSSDPTTPPLLGQTVPNIVLDEAGNLLPPVVEEPISTTVVTIPAPTPPPIPVVVATVDAPPPEVLVAPLATPTAPLAPAKFPWLLFAAVGAGAFYLLKKKE